MEPLEKFFEKRVRQGEFFAMMIPRYLENPDRFMGTKQYTLEQAEAFKKDAEKCRAVLQFLREYKNK